ncbi:CvpA family protein [Arhodomonas sp. AD133]|uniref:CvpA family protein n=1 Tax=Arhodomonas sp. AD133 TaxID=3415009 RepID=UPI003EC0FF75
MNWLDLVLLGVIAVSVLISIVRGFVREVLSIVAWGAAAWLSIRHAQTASVWLADYIDSPTFRIAAAFGLIFVGVLLVGAIVNYVAGQLVGRTGLSGTDRALGVVFGGLRGVVIIGVAVLIAGLTAVPREVWWRESTLVAWFTPRVCALGVRHWLTDLRVYSPLDDERVAEGTPARDYWREFCGDPRPPETGPGDRPSE